MIPHVPTSTVLRTLLGNVRADHLTLAALVDELRERSFGIVMLVMGLVGLVPGVSTFAGVMLVILAVQMMLARPSLVFPGFVGARRIPTAPIMRMARRAAPAFRLMEHLIRPRWPVFFQATQRAVGGLVFCLGALLLVPLPLSNLLPALAVVLMAFAYLEEDGILLCLAMIIAAALLAGAATAVWAMIMTASKLIG